jgi:hypothetical protein
MRIEIFDIDGTLTHAHGDIADQTGCRTYAFWPLITEHFTKDIESLRKSIDTWEESMKEEKDPTGSSHRMMQLGVESFHEGVTPDKVRQFAKETTQHFIKCGVVRKDAIAFLKKKIEDGVICILSTGSYQDGALGFVDALAENGLLELTSESKELLHISGAIVDWDNKKLLHANVRERKLVGIEIVMKQSITALQPYIKAAYGDDPWINDKDILDIAPRERSFVIGTNKNKEKTLPPGYVLNTWPRIIEQVAGD